MKVEIYSDVACPWCYVGKRRFEQALAAFPGEVEVVFRPYQLDPAAGPAPRPMLEVLAEKYGPQAAGMARNVADQARGDGITMNFDRVLAANTLSAHRLLWLAEREYGPAVQRTLAEALFDAHFTAGADIGDAAVLAELAARAGMDAERARAFLASDEGRPEVEAEIAEARGLGITAVPTFVFAGKYGVQGAQPASSFLQALEAVARETGSSPSASGSDGCEDGSCAV
jgi:predicted DsbA family dithiol-disulfide isomerase